MNTRSVPTTTTSPYSSAKAEAVCTRLAETMVLKAPIARVWEALREFKCNELFPTSVKKIHFLEGGSPCTVGSQYQLEWIDGTVATFRVVEVSEIEYCFTIEMIDVTPKQKYTSMLSTIQLKRVTEDNSTFVSWKTLYSSDVTGDVLSARKNLLAGYFKDLRALEKKM